MEKEKKFSRSSKVTTVQKPNIKPAHIQSVHKGGETKTNQKSSFIKKTPNLENAKDTVDCTEFILINIRFPMYLHGVLLKIVPFLVRLLGHVT